MNEDTIKTKCKGCEDNIKNQLGHVDGCLSKGTEVLTLHVLQEDAGTFRVTLYNSDMEIQYTYTQNKEGERAYANVVLNALDLSNEVSNCPVDLVLYSDEVYKLFTARSRCITNFIYQNRLKPYNINSVVNVA